MQEDRKHRWPEITRIMDYGKIKTGYYLCPDNPKLLLPDFEKIAFIEQGFDYLEAGSSSREVAEWVSQKILRTVSHQTIINLYNLHRKPYVRVKTQKITAPKKSRETKALIAAKVALRNAEKKQKETERKILEARASRKLKLEDYPTPPVPKVTPSSPEYLPPVPKEVSIIFKPNPGPQSLFLASTEEEVLYGGAAGGKLKSGFLCLLSSQEVKTNFVNCWNTFILCKLQRSWKRQA